MKKIVFILSSLQDYHAIKRIQEFKEHGYEYEVCGFSRDNGNLPDIPFRTIGQFVNGSSYFGRLFRIVPIMRRFLKEYDKQDVILFCFGFDIALFVFLFSKRKYIYESCDLMYTYFKIPFLCTICKWIDRKLIASSIETVLTSNGFVEYLYPSKTKPDNISLITNRLNPSVLNVLDSGYTKRRPDIHKLIISYNGFLRDNHLLLFAKTVAENYPDITIVFNGIVQNFNKKYTKILEQLKKEKNIKFTGEFKNPEDLPRLHRETDLLLCTYDTSFDNVRYLEPNKIYESILFHTPIIVSEGTYLAKKVKDLGIGFVVNAADPKSIKLFLDSLTVESILEKQQACAAIPEVECLNINETFFNKIRSHFLESF